MRKTYALCLVGVSIPAVVLLATTSAGAARPPDAGLKTYVADLSTPLNPQVSGASGTATITLQGDDLNVAITMSGLDDTVHAQHIHFGPICPEPAPMSEDDTNGDGFVDVLEGLPDYGGIFVNLDSDLDDPDHNAFPSGSSYTYTASGSRSAIQDSSGTALKLDRRHVVIHGVSEDLPDSVATLPGLPPESNSGTLPVACGELIPQD